MEVSTTELSDPIILLISHSNDHLLIMLTKHIIPLTLLINTQLVVRLKSYQKQAFNVSE